MCKMRQFHTMDFTHFPAILSTSGESLQVLDVALWPGLMPWMPPIFSSKIPTVDQWIAINPGDFIRIFPVIDLP